MYSIQERILQVIESKGITPYRVCKDLGLSMGYFDKRGAIGTDKYLKIIEYVPDINPDWLLTGRGDMLREDVKKEIKEPVSEEKNTDCEKKLSEKEQQINKLLDQLSESQRQVSKLLEQQEKLLNKL